MNDQQQTANETEQNADFLGMTVQIASAFAAHNSINHSEIPNLISNIHSTLTGLGAPKMAEPEVRKEPAVSVRSSIKPDYIVCLEDGKKLKMLKRHLMTHYQMTPDQYRAKWGLPADYPMVSPNYAEQRRSLAKAIGLGTLRRKRPGTATASAANSNTDTKTAPKADAPADAPKRRGRKPKAEQTPPKAARKAKTDDVPAKRGPGRPRKDAA